MTSSILIMKRPSSRDGEAHATGGVCNVYGRVGGKKGEGLCVWASGRKEGGGVMCMGEWEERRGRGYVYVELVHHFLFSVLVSVQFEL